MRYAYLRYLSYIVLVLFILLLRDYIHWMCWQKVALIVVCSIVITAIDLWISQLVRDVNQRVSVWKLVVVAIVDVLIFTPVFWWLMK